MKTIDALALLSDLHTLVFTTNDAAATLSISRPHAGKTLERLAAARQVIRLRRGLWAFPEKVDLNLLPSSLAAPSPCYVSLQSALYAHGMISQVPQRLYAVSTARTRAYNRPEFQIDEFLDVLKELFLPRKA